MTSIVISSGHSLKVRGAAGILDEVNEARKVVDEVARVLKGAGVNVITFHDDISTSQSENLDRIVDEHNRHGRDMDVSVHFNAYQTTTKPMGTEVLYKTQHQLADRVCDHICAAAGFTNRGPKERTDLAFLNGTNKPAILIETCFVDSEADADIYRAKFSAICTAIAEGIVGVPIDGSIDVPPPETTQPSPPTGERSTLKKGSTGPDVVELQTALGIPADGDFGSITDAQVKAFQAACGLPPDGVVDSPVWTQIDFLTARKDSGGEGLTGAEEKNIIALAQTSPLMSYSWPDRGKSPAGYLPGMALSFAIALQWYNENEPAAQVMAAAAGHPDTDALKYCQPELDAKNLDCSRPGVDTLRHLFVLMIGLGMRESSGQYCEGRDQSASNVQADTCEAGLFQTSWNINTAHSSIPMLMHHFWDDPNGWLPTFDDGVNPSAADLGCYGTGEGAKYQFLAKYVPLFAVMTTAVGLRTRRKHWGPIERHEVTIRNDANNLLMEVQELMDAGTTPEPGPEPEPLPGQVIVNIVTLPGIEVIVNVTERVQEPQRSGQRRDYGKNRS
jgi:hypothetical protein